MKETIIISLGGSLVVPDEIDVRFLKEFRKIIIKHLGKKRFFLIVGGGRTCRKYQKAARKIVRLSKDDVDWIGIHSTRLNAHLLRTIFKEYACPRIIKNPTEKINLKKNISAGKSVSWLYKNMREKSMPRLYDILIAAGWKPGCSTDLDAVLLAKNFKIKTMVNMTNVEYVYDKDPKKYKNAKPLKKIEWKNFRKLVGDKWDPGLHAPFDPIASKQAERMGMKVAIMGKNLRNLDNFLKGKKFRGTAVE